MKLVVLRNDANCRGCTPHKKVHNHKLCNSSLYKSLNWIKTCMRSALEICFRYKEDLHNQRCSPAAHLCFASFAVQNCNLWNCRSINAPFQSSPATIFAQKTNQPTYQNEDHSGNTFIRGLRLSNSWWLLP